MPIHVDRSQEIARFYIRHAARLRRAIIVKTAGLDDAVIDDACAFAWEQLLRRPDIDLERKEAYGWLRTVALREAWALGRHQRREQPAGGMSGADESPEPVADEDNIVDIVADHLEHATILKVLGELHWRERRELLLYAHGLSYQEIAEVTNTSYSAVNKWLDRGKKALRTARDRGRITPDDPRWQPRR